MSEFLDLIGQDTLAPNLSNRHNIGMPLFRLREIQLRCEESHNYACLLEPTSP